MKNCDACGDPKANNSIGGAMLCHRCFEDVRVQVDALRAQGKPTNAMGIARAMFRETHSAGNYLLRDIPKELMDQIRGQAHQRGVSMRDWMLESFRKTLS